MLLMLGVSLAVLLLITVFFTTLFFLSNLTQAGFAHSLSERSDDSYVISIVVPNRPIGVRDYEKLDSFVAETIDQSLTGSNILYETVRKGLSQSLPYVDEPGDKVSSINNSLASFVFQERFIEFSDLVSGRWATNTGDSTEDMLFIEGVVGVEAFEDLDWALGETVYVSPFPSKPEEIIALEIVGVVQPKDESSWFWSDGVSKFNLTEVGGSEKVTVFMDKEIFFEKVAKRYPVFLGGFWWQLLLDSQETSYANASSLGPSLRDMEIELNKQYPSSYVISVLGNIISDYQTKLSSMNVAYFIYISLVVVVLILFIAIAAGALAFQWNSKELMLLKARGISLISTGIALPIIKGLLIVMPGVILGPVVALVTNGILLSGNSEISSLSFSTFVLSGLLGAVLVAVYVVVYLSASAKIVNRNPAKGFSLYTATATGFELIVIFFASLAWWQLGKEGTFFQDATGVDGGNLQLLALFAPSLIIVALGIIVIRALPVVFLACKLFLKSWTPLWISITNQRLIEDYERYRSVVLILIIITALAVFAGTVPRTLVAGYFDQAKFSLGAEAVVKMPVGKYFNATSTVAKLEDSYLIQTASPVYRTQVFGGSQSDGVSYLLLGIDSEKMADVSWFRQRFAGGKPLSAFAKSIKGDPIAFGGIPVPDNAEKIGLWVRSERPFPNYNIRLLLRDDSGKYETIKLGSLDDTDWVYKDVEITGLDLANGSLNLVGIYVSGGYFLGYGGGSIQLDDISVSKLGEISVLEDFESDLGWDIFPSLGLTQDNIFYEIDSPKSGKRSLSYVWTDPITTTIGGIFASPVPMPIPAIGGMAFSENQRIVVRIDGQPIVFEIEAVVSDFPTLYPTNGRFIVADFGHLSSYIDLLPQLRPIKTSELWLDLPSQPNVSEISKLIEDTIPGGILQEQGELVGKENSDPLKVNVWARLHLISLVVIGSVLGVVLCIFGFRETKQVRKDLTGLQLMGMSKLHTIMSVALKNIVLLVISMSSGILIGMYLTTWLLQFLDSPLGNVAVVPSLEVTFNPRIFGVVIIEIFGAVALACLLVVSVGRKLELSTLLRVEEK